MKISAMRVRIIFQKNTVVKDKYGNHMNTWTDYFSCWATVSTGTGSESDGEVIRQEEFPDFTCRWCQKLLAVESTKYRILAEGRIYNITSVDPMGYRRNSIKFSCKLEKKS